MADTGLSGRNVRSRVRHLTAPQSGAGPAGSQVGPELPCNLGQNFFSCLQPKTILAQEFFSSRPTPRQRQDIDRDHRPRPSPAGCPPHPCAAARSAAPPAGPPAAGAGLAEAAKQLAGPAGGRPGVQPACAAWPLPPGGLLTCLVSASDFSA